MSNIKFFRGSIFIFVVFVLNKFSYVLTVPALTKNLTQSQYGAWIQVWVTVGLLIPLTSFCLGTAAVRYLAGERNKVEAGKIFMSMFIILFVSMVSILLLLIIFAPLLSYLIFSSISFISLAYLTIAWLGVKTTFAFFSSILRAYEEFKTYGLLLLLDGISLVIFVYIIIPTTRQIEFLLYALIIFGGLLSLISFIWAKKYIVFTSPSWSRIKDIVFYSLPLIPNAALSWIISSSDRYFITHMLSLAENGVYSVTYTISSIISLLFAPLGVVLFPVICSYWNQDNENNKNEIKKYIENTIYYLLLIAIPIIGGVFGLWPSVVSLFSSTQYVTSRFLFLIISLGIMFNGINLINGYVLQLGKKTSTIMVISATGALLNLGLNFILIPKYGLMGAGIATFISYLLMVIASMTIAREIISYSMEWKRLLACLSISAVMGFGLWLCQPRLFLGSAIGVVFYVVLMMVFGIIDKKEINLVKKLVSSVSR